MLASFSVVPLDVGLEFREHVAKIISLVEGSGLDYRLGAMETSVEGDWDEIMSLVKRCHCAMKEVSPRVLTRISIDDRRGAKGRLTGKIRDVEEIPGREVRHD